MHNTLKKKKDRIIDGLTSGTSKLRIIFATVAFGVGLDLNNIRQIIHLGVPCTMEQYFQEAGRAGKRWSSFKSTRFIIPMTFQKPENICLLL